MIRPGKLVRLGALGVVLHIWATGPGFAQNRPIDKARAQRAVAVPEAPPGEAQEKKEDEPAVDPDDRTPLGVDIAAVRLIAHQDKAEEGPEIGDEKVEIDPEIPAPDGLAEILEGYLEQPVSMGLLADLAKDIIVAWRDTDYPLVDVYFPEQNITEGKIQIVVREAVLGEVKVEGAKHSRPEYLRNQIRVKPGDRINQRIVEADLDWLNENPIRQVNLIYDRGQEDGTSDMVLQTNEVNSLTLYTGFANTGLNLTGQNEFSAGINWANPFKTEQSIGYNYGSNIDFDTLHAHSVFYRLFLPWRHEIRVIGAYVVTDVPGEPTEDMPPIDITGENIQATVDYRIPLPRLRKLRSLRQYFSVGTDYKSTDTDLLFGGPGFFDSIAAVLQFRAAYEATLPDKFGYTRLSLASIWSPGDTVVYNDDVSFQMLRAGSTADYWYGQAELERVCKLPFESLLRLRARGQTSDARLISTEQILAGGYTTVRGFDENLIRGDSGVIVNAELISPQFSLIGLVIPQVEDQWNLIGFYDGALVGVTEGEIGLPDQSIQSAGLEIQCRIADWVYGRFGYGWNIDTYGVLEEVAKDGKAHFGITIRK